MQLTHCELRQGVLLLSFSPQPDVSCDLVRLRQWLQQHQALQHLQAEQGADLLQISFEFQRQRFCLQLEHYSDSCWVEADSAGGRMLLSALQAVLADASLSSPAEQD